MKADDTPVGRLLTRREALAILGAAGVVVLSRPAFTLLANMQANAAPACVVRPAQTEGPYFVDERLNRADIRKDPTNGKTADGIPLELTLAVMAVSSTGCTPLRNALVDIWQCDAAGIYSDVEDPHFNTVGQKFLRGYQQTDAKGIVRFNTIYPGWYPDRTVHIHFKVRSGAKADRAHEFTSQIYFPDDFTDRVFARAPYSTRGTRNRRNEQDRIYQEGGDQLIASVRESGSGYAADFAVGMHLG